MDFEKLGYDNEKEELSIILQSIKYDKESDKKVAELEVVRNNKVKKYVFHCLIHITSDKTFDVLGEKLYTYEKKHKPATYIFDKEWLEKEKEKIKKALRLKFTFIDVSRLTKKEQFCTGCFYNRVIKTSDKTKTFYYCNRCLRYKEVLVK